MGNSWLPFLFHSEWIIISCFEISFHTHLMIEVVPWSFLLTFASAVGSFRLAISLNWEWDYCPFIEVYFHSCLMMEVVQWSLLKFAFAVLDFRTGSMIVWHYDAIFCFWNWFWWHGFRCFIPILCSIPQLNMFLKQVFLDHHRSLSGLCFKLVWLTLICLLVLTACHFVLIWLVSGPGA